MTAGCPGRPQALLAVVLGIYHHGSCVCVTMHVLRGSVTGEWPVKQLELAEKQND